MKMGWQKTVYAEKRVQLLATSLPNPELFSKDVEVFVLHDSSSDDDNFGEKKTEVATIMTINPKRRMLTMIVLIDKERKDVIDESACRTRATTKVMITKMLTNCNNK
jgi:hypothetical protein